MKNTDFIDQDLVKGQETVATGDGSPGGDEDDLVPVRAISNMSLGRMARHKDDVSSGMVRAVNEMEQLRRRQQELEQERGELEELSRKQVDYENGKREVIEHLNEGIIALEKKEVQTAQLGELLSATRSRFKSALDEIEAIDEGQWPEERFREELYKALVIVDDARMDYNKALAKIDVVEGRAEPVFENMRTRAGVGGGISDMSIGQLLRVGLALGLPVMIFFAFMAVMFVVLYVVQWL